MISNRLLLVLVRRPGTCTTAGPARSASCSAAWTACRARITEECSSTGRGTRPAGCGRGDDRGATIELGLLAGEPQGQVCPGLGQAVRAVRDLPDHRLPCRDVLSAPYPERDVGVAQRLDPRREDRTPRQYGPEPEQHPRVGRRY
jgi:hypothetical protein